VATGDRIAGFTVAVSNSPDSRCGSSFIFFGIMTNCTTGLGIIPYAEIEDAVGTQRKAPNSGDGLSYVPEEDALYLATGGKTDAALRLLAPRSMRGFLKETEPASRIHLAVDEPDRFVRELRQRMETSISGSGVDRAPPSARSGQHPKHATRHHSRFAKCRF
jgi:hypothetical protein